MNKIAKKYNRLSAAETRGYNDCFRGVTTCPYKNDEEMQIFWNRGFQDAWDAKLEMKPTKEVEQIARKKAEKLQDGQQVRVGGAPYVKSYWVFRVQGNLYIGCVASEMIGNGRFFKDRSTVPMAKADGTIVAQVQRLF